MILQASDLQETSQLVWFNWHAGFYESFFKIYSCESSVMSYSKLESNFIKIRESPRIYKDSLLFKDSCNVQRFMSLQRLMDLFICFLLNIEFTPSHGALVYSPLIPCSSCVKASHGTFTRSKTNYPGACFLPRSLRILYRLAWPRRLLRQEEL